MSIGGRKVKGFLLMSSTNYFLNNINDLISDLVMCEAYAYDQAGLLWVCTGDLYLQTTKVNYD